MFKWGRLKWAGNSPKCPLFTNLFTHNIFLLGNGMAIARRQGWIFSLKVEQKSMCETMDNVLGLGVPSQEFTEYPDLDWGWQALWLVIVFVAWDWDLAGCGTWGTGDGTFGTLDKHAWNDTLFGCSMHCLSGIWNNILVGFFPLFSPLPPEMVCSWLSGRPSVQDPDGQLTKSNVKIPYRNDNVNRRKPNWLHIAWVLSHVGHMRGNRLVAPGTFEHTPPRKYQMPPPILSPKAACHSGALDWVPDCPRYGRQAWTPTGCLGKGVHEGRQICAPIF